VQRPQGATGVKRSPHGLAIDGDHLAR
jgi:hypothetical protein